MSQETIYKTNHTFSQTTYF